MIFGILAHVDAGKTTLSEALLYTTGGLRSLGRVDHQDTYLDTDSQERERGITIFSKQARINVNGQEITLLDTPGHVDFSAEMERTLQVLDYAILVISGTDGVQGHTRTLWRLLKHYNVPTFIFVNKMDMAGANQDTLMEELKRELSDGCCDFTKAAVCFDKPEQEVTGDICEDIATCNEKILDEYMEKEKISFLSISDAIGKRQLFPCFFGSALKVEGVEVLIKGITCLARNREYGKDFAARVYKIGRDTRGLRLTFLKVTGGRLMIREKLEYQLVGSEEEVIVEKIDQIRKYSGEKYESVDFAEAGEIVAVTGLSSTYPGQGLGAERNTNQPMLEPVLNYQLILPKEINPMEFMKNMRILEEEDPQLYVVWEEDRREIQVQLMGQIQMEVLVRQIKDRFGVVVTFGPGSIVYKETVARTVEGVGHFEPLRHYAEVHLLLSPGERGSGITVDSVCSEDILDKNWQRLIATHIEEREHKGVLTGSVLTDVKVTILTGRAHIKHTEGGDFRQATYRAIRQGLKSTECILLEPYYNLSLEIPMDFVGRALTDLQQRFAKVSAPEFCNKAGRELALIKGQAPVSTMQDYVGEVHAYTKGLGHLLLELSGYDVCHNPAEVIEERGYDSELDFRNSTGSVFCAHGSGFVVPWDEVANYMHLPYVYTGDTSKEALQAAARDGLYYDSQGMAIAGNISGGGRESWEKSVAKMTSVELDAELADVYKREFKMDKSDMEDAERKKWAKAKSSIPEGLSGKPRTLKHDKKGNPIIPVRKRIEEFLIVDGYNVIFAWSKLKELSKTNLDSARDRLNDILLNYQAYRDCRLMVVYDAYRVKGNAGRKEFYDGLSKKLRQGPAPDKSGKGIKGIEVVYTRTDQIADAFIEKTVHEEKENYQITVVTNDGLEQLTILGQGALRMTAGNLLEEIESL